MKKILGFSSFKGGTGKTTLSYAMAERGYSVGLRTLMLDFDPQETALGMAYLREIPGWEVRRCQVSVAGAEELTAIADSGDYDLVVCDLPGSEGATLQRVLASMTLILCPVGMGAPDMLVASNFAWIARRMALPVVFVGNNLPPGRRRREELVADLEVMELPVCPEMVQSRVAHIDAMSHGQSAAEWAPATAASAELEALWRWIAAEVGIVLEDMQEAVAV
ncbi:MAG: ParA family protein [Chloroflexi bacterium]|nr:ParA family protein [Chloroflexota bacterium]